MARDCFCARCVLCTVLLQVLAGIVLVAWYANIWTFDRLFHRNMLNVSAVCNADACEALLTDCTPQYSSTNAMHVAALFRSLKYPSCVIDLAAHGQDQL